MGMTALAHLFGECDVSQASKLRIDPSYLNYLVTEAFIAAQNLERDDRFHFGNDFTASKILDDLVLSPDNAIRKRAIHYPWINVLQTKFNDQPTVEQWIEISKDLELFYKYKMQIEDLNENPPAITDSRAVKALETKQTTLRTRISKIPSIKNFFP